jgi:hypothetical protein
MKPVVGGIELKIYEGELEVASVSYGEDESNPLYERTWLFATEVGGFSLVGGGGSLTLWRRRVGDYWEFDCGRIPITPHEALAWAGRHAPTAAYWVNVVIRHSERGRP